MSPDMIHDTAHTREYVTVMIAGQALGVPVTDIHDVFAPVGVTPVPLGPREVAGVLNLRGRIVTIIDARVRLGLEPRTKDEPGMAVGLERKGESFGLLVDAVGEVLRLSVDDRQANPCNLDSRWQDVSAGVFRLEGRLLVEIDIDRLLSSEQDLAA